MRVKLENEDLIVEVAPACGGSMTRFDYKNNHHLVPIFRRCDEHLIEQLSALGASCFPLMPYSNRLRHGKFKVDNRQYSHALNCLPERHSSHGDAWMRPWTVIKNEQDYLEISLEADDQQPIKYRGTQVIRLEKKSLSIMLSITNVDHCVAPFGIGLHPYFPRSLETKLICDLQHEWHLDHELMPIKLVPNLRKQLMECGSLIDDLPQNGAYYSSSTDAEISLAYPGLSVRVETEPSLKHAILWCPEGQDFFCYEPVSHAIDGFNLVNAGVEHTGVQYLSPNSSYEVRWTFSIDHKNQSFSKV